MRRPRPHIFVILGMLTAFLSVGCATGRAPDSGASRASADSVQAKIKPLVEDLYLKTRDLEAIYLDLRTVANAFAFLPDDRQLSHIQKTALYVQNALQGATHQWEFLSIMEDIKPAARQDYFTLRHRALQKTADETRYDVRFLKLYQAYITNAEAQKDINGAAALMDGIQKIYGRLIDAIAPLVRQGLPTTI
jgi:hypothetical protein